MDSPGLCLQKQWSSPASEHVGGAAPARRCGDAGCHSFVYHTRPTNVFLFYPGEAPCCALPRLYEKACESTPRRGTLVGLREPSVHPCSSASSQPPPMAPPSPNGTSYTSDAPAQPAPHTHESIVRQGQTAEAAATAAAAAAPATRPAPKGLMEGGGCGAAPVARWGRQFLSPAAPAGA